MGLPGDVTKPVDYLRNYVHGQGKGIYQSVEVLPPAKAPLRLCLRRTQDTRTYLVQSYRPLEEMELDFNAAIQRLIEVTNQNTPRSA